VVAFAAVSFLGLFLPDLAHQVRPLNFLLNGVAALFAVFGFARSQQPLQRRSEPMLPDTAVEELFAAYGNNQPLDREAGKL